MTPQPVLPRRAALFAQMPPAVFPAILGLIGLGLAWRRALAAFGADTAAADLALGMAAALWAFAVLAYLSKLARRPAVLAEDLRVLPGRAGLAAATMGGMAVAAALVPVQPMAAAGLLVAALAAHGALALATLWHFAHVPAASRPVDPAWHLSFVGFILGGIAATGLGWTALATALVYATLPVAVAIWLTSLRQMIGARTPAPLRPLLAIHLAPAALLATVAALAGLNLVALAALALGAVLLTGLILAAPWVLSAGFSPLWGALTFPLAAYVSALFVHGMAVTASLLLALATVMLPVIAARILAAWAKGSLAARTHAARA